MKRLSGQGGFAISWFVITLPVLTIFLGLVLDFGIFMLRSQQLDAASDAAALAATDAWDREYWKQNGRVRIDASRAERLARQYLNKNLTGARLKRITVSPANRVNIETEIDVPFFFLRVAGWQEQTATSFSTAVRRNVR